MALELTCTINLLLQLVFRSLDGLSLASSETGQGLMMVNRDGVSGDYHLGRPRQGWNPRSFQFNVWALTWTGNPFSGAEQVFLGGGQFLFFSDFKISRLS